MSITMSLHAYPDNAECVSTLTDPHFWEDNAAHFTAGEMACLTHLLNAAGASKDTLRDIWKSWADNDEDVTITQNDGTALTIVNDDGDMIAEFKNGAEWPSWNRQ